MPLVLKQRAFLGGVIRLPGHVVGPEHEAECRAYPEEVWGEAEKPKPEPKPEPEPEPKPEPKPEPEPEQKPEPEPEPKPAKKGSN